ncbi:hypothetical protein [Streptomyces melanogenes]|uniref:hypothetical protein n=1 Tax=Streptomyces melanogenes TaxID=67326 RepID=UPI0037AA152C
MPELTGDEPLPARSRSLGRDRDFAVFWAAQTLSVVGDWVALVALTSVGSLSARTASDSVGAGASSASGASVGPTKRQDLQAASAPELVWIRRPRGSTDCACW